MNGKFRRVQFGLRSLLTVTLLVAVSFAIYRWYRGATVVFHKMTFDGLQDVIVVPDQKRLDFNDDFTIEACVRLPSRQSSMKWSSCIVGKGTGVWNTNKNYFLGIVNRSNQVEFHIGDAKGGYQDVFSNQTIIAGQWTHIAAVRSEDALLIYINGVLDSKETPRFIDQESNDEPLRIGGADHSSCNFLPDRRHRRCATVELRKRRRSNQARLAAKSCSNNPWIGASKQSESCPITPKSSAHRAGHSSPDRASRTAKSWKCNDTSAA